MLHSATLIRLRGGKYLFCLFGCFEEVLCFRFITWLWCMSQFFSNCVWDLYFCGLFTEETTFNIFGLSQHRLGNGICILHYRQQLLANTMLEVLNHTQYGQNQLCWPSMFVHATTVTGFQWLSMYLHTVQCEAQWSTRQPGVKSLSLSCWWAAAHPFCWLKNRDSPGEWTGGGWLVMKSPLPASPLPKISMNLSAFVKMGVEWTVGCSAVLL